MKILAIILILMNLISHAQIEKFDIEKNLQPIIITDDSCYFICGVSEKNTLIITKYDFNLNFIKFIEISSPPNSSVKLDDSQSFKIFIFGDYLQVRFDVNKVRTKNISCFINKDLSNKIEYSSENNLNDYKLYKEKIKEKKDNLFWEHTVFTPNIQIGNYIYFYQTKLTYSAVTYAAFGTPGWPKYYDYKGANRLVKCEVITSLESGKIFLKEIWQKEIPQTNEAFDVQILNNNGELILCYVNSPDYINIEKVDLSNGEISPVNKIDISDFSFNKKTSLEIPQEKMTDRNFFILSDYFGGNRKIETIILDQDFKEINRSESSYTLPIIFDKYKFEYYGDITEFKNEIYYSKIFYEMVSYPGVNGGATTFERKPLGIIDIKLEKNHVDYKFYDKKELKVIRKQDHFASIGHTFIGAKDKFYHVALDPTAISIKFEKIEDVTFLELDNKESFDTSVDEIIRSDNIGLIVDSYDQSTFFVQSLDGTKIMWFLLVYNTETKVKSYNVFIEEID